MLGQPLGVMVDHHLVKVLQDESKAFFLNFHSFSFPSTEDHILLTHHLAFSLK